VDLDALASEPNLDPMLALLTLPVQKEPDLGPCAQRTAHSAQRTAHSAFWRCGQI